MKKNGLVMLLACLILCIPFAQANEENEVLQNKKIIKQIIKENNKLIKANNYTSDLFYEQGRLYYLIKNDDKAWEYLNLAVLMNENNAPALTLTGDIEYYKNNSIFQAGKAFEYYQKALKIDPKNINALVGLFNIYSEISDYDNALNMINKAVKIEPENIGLYEKRADLYSKINECQKAIEDYNFIIKNETEKQDLAWFYLKRGDCYYYLGKYDNATNDYKQSVELDKKLKKFIKR